jgi:hypothetical protein
MSCGVVSGRAESFSRSHGCSLYPPNAGFHTDRWRRPCDQASIAYHWPVARPAATTSQRALLTLVHPFACRKCTFKIGFRNPRVLLISYTEFSWNHSSFPLSSECLFDCQLWLDLTYRKDYYSVTHVSDPICCPFSIVFPCRANIPGYR